jgi:hypothetical protein
MLRVKDYNGTSIYYTVLETILTQICFIQGVCVPRGVPLAVVIGKEGFIVNAVDAAAPPTAPNIVAFSIRKLRISSKAFIISSIISDI